jgi:regulator of nucleoside diphosphate kinase
MKKITNNPVLLKDDYVLLTTFLNGGYDRSTFNSRNAEDLKQELKKATIVESDQFPADAVRINSVVQIRDINKNVDMELVLVTPDRADIKKKRISVMSPVGTALIGFRKGQKVKWDVPAGKRTFVIVNVVNLLS